MLQRFFACATISRGLTTLPTKCCSLMSKKSSTQGRRRRQGSQGRGPRGTSRETRLISKDVQRPRDNVRLISKYSKQGLRCLMRSPSSKSDARSLFQVQMSQASKASGDVRLIFVQGQRFLMRRPSSKSDARSLLQSSNTLRSPQHHTKSISICVYAKT